MKKLIIIFALFGIVNFLFSQTEEVSQDDLLVRAIQRNQLTGVKKAISAGANVNGRDSDGKPVLFHAIDRNSKTIFNELSKHSLDVNSRDSENTPAILYALQKNKSTAVTFLLSMDANVNVTDTNGQTPLMEAIAVRRSKSYVQQLVSKGAEVSMPQGIEKLYPAGVAYDMKRNDLLKIILENNKVGDAVTKSGVPLIVDAVNKNRRSDLITILAAGGDPNAKTEENDPIIVLAIQKAHSTLVQPLLDAGVNINTTNKEGKSLLLLAHEGFLSRINNTRLSILEILLKANADPNTKTQGGRTLLQDYVAKGMAIPTNLLLKYGANSRLIDEKGNYLLHLASISGNTTVIQTTLGLGTPVNTKGDNGNTPLLFATLGNHTSAVNLLLKNGADPNIKNDKGETALTISIGNQNLVLAKSLIQNNADLNIKNQYGNPLIMEICSVDSFQTNNTTFQIIDLLLKGGAGINTFNEYGNNCLAYSINRKNTKMLDFLLKKGANPNLKDNEGRTSLHKAVKASAFDRLKNEQLKEIFYLLLDNGADPNVVDKEGRTPLHHAAIQENGRDATGALQAMEILLDYSADPMITDNSGSTPLKLASSNSLFRELLEPIYNPPRINSIQSENIVHLTQNSRGELYTIVKKGENLYSQILSSNGILRKEFPIPDGEKITVDIQGNIWILGRNLGDINGKRDSRCKKDQNFVITLRKFNPQGIEELSLTEGRSSACQKTIPMDIKFNPMDGNIYFAAMFLSKERNIYKLGADNAILRIARPSGSWNQFEITGMGNLSIQSSRYMELDQEGKTILNSPPRSITGRKFFSITPESDFYYSGVIKKSSKDQDIWISLFKENKSMEWRKIFSSSDLEEIEDMRVDSNSQLYLMGSSTGNFHGINSTSNGGKSGKSYFLTKLNREGKRIYTLSLDLEVNPKETILHSFGYSFVFWVPGSKKILILPNP